MPKKQTEKCKSVNGGIKSIWNIFAFFGGEQREKEEIRF